MMIDSQKSRMVVLAMMGLALAGMFVWSFLYRAQNPSMVASLERPASAQGGGAGGGMGNSQAMNDVMAAMSRLQKNPDDLDAMMDAAESFMAAQMWDKSVVILERAIKRAPADQDVQNHYGVALFNADRPADAAKQFELMLTADPTNYRAQFNLGAVTKYGLKDPAKALGYFQAAAANPKTDPQTLAQAKQELESTK